MVVNEIDSGSFLEFNYDQSILANNGDTIEDRGSLRLIPRAVELVDYTEGGPDFNANALNDNGAADEIHGESGDDEIYGQIGSDIIFGDAQDDNIIGGWGHDWISGGAGIDGVLGDDGRIYTSRNGTAGEPLYGIAAVQVNVEIRTPGDVQQAIINAENELNKAVNLTPFNVDGVNSAQDFLFDPQYADDVIYGGLGDDFLHGGSGDDAISGAEALSEVAVELFPDNGVSDASRTDSVIIITGYDNPVNPGHLLSYEALRAEEFAAYDEFEPRKRIIVDGKEFLLNFATNEGVLVDLDDNPVHSDGNDRIFGDLGNDWLVGGTGEDNMYGGYGNDLMNADDDHSTSAGANDQPDGPQASYEDTAFGGAGRDVMIGNTGGDRLIDWAGEFNSYIVPFAPFGLGTVSRSPQPALMQYLYDLSAADGADATRVSDTGSSVERNGEPYGELGLVKQQDADWQDQTGAPDDPQPGNIPGGGRDVLRGADFNTGGTANSGSGFFVDSGSFSIESGRLQVAPENLYEDAVSVLHVDAYTPAYFEIQATINAGKPTAGFKSNAFFVFDYQNKFDFKYAGINISNDKLEMGYRDATGWHELAQDNAQLKADKDYNVLLSINGLVATLVVDGSEIFQHTFDARIDETGYAWGLNSGSVGLGANNSIARLDNVVVQVLPPEITLEKVNDFDNGVADLFVDNVVSESERLPGVVGNWQVANGRYDASVIAGETAYSTTDIEIDSNYQLILETELNTQSMSGFIFDQYSEDDYKFVAISADTGEVVIGHNTPRRGLVIDSSIDRGIVAGTDYNLKITLDGSIVSVELDNQIVLGHVFNAVVVDGAYGLYSHGGDASFNTFTVQTDDRAYDGYLNETEELIITNEVAGNKVLTDSEILTADEVDTVVAPLLQEAKNRWITHLGYDPFSALNITVVVEDLGGLSLGKADHNAEGEVITVDTNAAGHGWFIDLTPGDDAEFTIVDGWKLTATPDSEAYGKIDLLTVLMHELGHVIDMEHMSEGVMRNVLSSSTRHLIAENDETTTETTEPALLTTTYTNDYTEGGGLALDDNGTTTSSIVITDNVTIEDINIQLNISHARESDLSVYLVAADGTTIELVADVDTGSYGLTNMLLDDDAAASVTEASITNDGTTTYQAIGDLSDLENMSMQGTWQLVVTDDRNGRTGVLNSWSMVVQHNVDPV